LRALLPPASKKNADFAWVPMKGTGKGKGKDSRGKKETHKGPNWERPPYTYIRVKGG